MSTYTKSKIAWVAGGLLGALLLPERRIAGALLGALVVGGIADKAIENAECAKVTL